MKSLLFLFTLVTLSTTITVDYHSIDSTIEKDAFIAILIICGAFLTFLGIQLFKPTVFLLSFLGAFIVSTSIIGPHLPSVSYIYTTGVCIALGFASFSVTFIGLGLMLVGLFAGSLFAGICYIAFLNYIPDQSSAFLYTFVGLSGLIGCFIGFKATRMFVILSTALCGAFSVVCGIDIATDRQLTIENAQAQHHLNGLGWGLIAIWASLALLGAAIQSQSRSYPKELRSQKYRGIGKVMGDKNDPLIHHI